MMQNNDKYFEELYGYVREQRHYVSQLVRFLTGSSQDMDRANLEQPLSDPASISLKEIRKKVEQRATLSKHKAQPLGEEEVAAYVHHLFRGEKETTFSAYQKLMQLLQKWTELQLSILKEWQKTKEDEQSSPVNMSFEEEDRMILQQFFMQQQDAKD